MFYLSLFSTTYLLRKTNTKKHIIPSMSSQFQWFYFYERNTLWNRMNFILSCIAHVLNTCTLFYQWRILPSNNTNMVFTSSKIIFWHIYTMCILYHVVHTSLAWLGRYQQNILKINSFHWMNKKYEWTITSRHKAAPARWRYVTRTHVHISKWWFYFTGNTETLFF